MATGILQPGSNLSAVENTTVYIVPAATFTVATVSVCNRSSSTVTIRLAVSTTGAPNAADYLEFGTQILANGVLERSGIVLQTGYRLVAYSSAVDVNVVVFGIETSTA